MDRILRDTPAKIRITLRDELGNLRDADANALNAVVTDSAGASVMTSTATTRESAGVYRLNVPAAKTAVLDAYTVRWSGLFSAAAEDYVTEYEVVGANYFSTAEARVFDNAAFADTTKFPTQSITEARALVEEQLEDEIAGCGVAFVRRGFREKIDGNCADEILLKKINPRAIVAVSIDGTSQDISTFDVDDAGTLIRTDGKVFPKGRRNVAVLYEHGYDAPPPRVKRAALILLKDRLLSSNVSDRAVSHTDESGTTMLAVPGRYGWKTGIPEVDAVIKDARERAGAIG